MRSDTEIVVQKTPRLKDPLFIEGLTGIGHVGRTAAGYLIDHLGATKFAEVHSNHFPHWAIVQEDNTLELLKNELYYWKAKKKSQRDLVFLIGNAQSLDPQGHYQIAHAVLAFLRDTFKLKDMITLGGFGTGELVEEPKVLGVVSENIVHKRYAKYGITFEHSVGQIVGASGLLLGLGRRYGMTGICLLGETPGFLLSDPHATEEMLKVLEKVLKVSIDYSSIESKVREAEEVLKRIQRLQKEIQDKHSDSSKDLAYIG